MNARLAQIFTTVATLVVLVLLVVFLSPGDDESIDLSAEAVSNPISPAPVLATPTPGEIGEALRLDRPVPDSLSSASVNDVLDDEVLVDEPVPTSDDTDAEQAEDSEEAAIFFDPEVLADALERADEPEPEVAAPATATATATPRPTATTRPSATPTPRPSSTPSATPRATASPTPAGPTPTPRGIGQPTPAGTATPTPTPSITPTPTATPRPTSTPRPSSTPTPRPSSTPLPTATATATPFSTSTPTPTPTSLPTATPTSLPTATPTATPAAPTSTPVPTAAPVGLAAPGCPAGYWNLATFPPTTQFNGVSLCGIWAGGVYASPPADSTALAACGPLTPANSTRTSWRWHDTQQLACHYWVTANGVYAF